MLGITTADAIAFGSMVAAAMAAYAGLIRGERAKKAVPPDTSVAMIGSALVDRETLRDLTEAVKDLTSALQSGIRVGEVRSRDHLADQIRDLVERADHRPSRR